MIPSGVCTILFTLVFICLILFGINDKCKTIERLNREYIQCVYQGNTEQICNKLYKE